MPRRGPVRVAIVRNDAWVISSSPPMPRATRTTIDPNSAISVRSGSPTTQPITPPESVTPLTEKPSGPLTTWMIAERGEADERPADDQAVRARRPGAADERHADGQQDQRQDVAAEPGEGAAEPLDAVAEDAGEVEVDRRRRG